MTNEDRRLIVGTLGDLNMITQEPAYAGEIRGGGG
jgi:hypothetical protein